MFQLGLDLSTAFHLLASSVLSVQVEVFATLNQCFTACLFARRALFGRCRDKETGKQRGFAFLAYEDQRSTVLAVDNLSGARVGGRTIRVDHVDNYKIKRAEVHLLLYNALFNSRLGPGGCAG